MPLSFKAGRLFRSSPDSNTVQADPQKGTLDLRIEDDLLHLYWKPRPSTSAALDLIIFPGDASFFPVSQAGSDNVYALKFESSNELHFFWFQQQDAPYETFSQHINAMIDDPDFVPPSAPAAVPSFSSAPPATPAPSAPPSSVPAAPNPRRTAGFNIAQTEGGGYTPEQLAQLQAMLEGQAGGAAEELDGPSLTEILTPAILAPILSHSSLRASLFPHLPSDLPISNPPTQDEINSVIQSSQFKAGVSSLDRALRTGNCGPLVAGLGLPMSAGSSLKAFLEAIGAQASAGEPSADAEGGDRMQMD